MCLHPLLGVFFEFYGKNADMSFSRAVLVSVLGFIMVVLILAVIALFIKAIALIFSFFVKSNSVKVDKVNSAISSENKFNTVRSLNGYVKLIDVDESTAAVLMAVTAFKTGIPVERLNFKYIKCLNENEDKE